MQTLVLSVIANSLTTFWAWVISWIIVEQTIFLAKFCWSMSIHEVLAIYWVTGMSSWTTKATHNHSTKVTIFWHVTAFEVQLERGEMGSLDGDRWPTIRSGRASTPPDSSISSPRVSRPPRTGMFIPDCRVFLSWQFKRGRKGASLRPFVHPTQVSSNPLASTLHS